MKNKNLISLLIIIVGLSFVMLTSLLLDWSFIQKQFSRQIIVYLMMILEIYVFYKMWLNVEKIN